MTVRLYLLFFLLMFISPSAAGEGIFITADTLAKHSLQLKLWKYSSADSPQMALPEYDDSRWKEIDPSFRNDTADSFAGIGWFRLHFNTDSSMKNYPVAIVMEQMGASEIYLDGELIKSFGEIRGIKDSKYYNPAGLPFIITLKNSGPHVFSIRYANFESEYQSRKYLIATGFQMTLGNTESKITLRDQNSRAISFIMALLGGIFLALSFLHLFMFLFYKSERANLFFSLFTISVGISLLIGFIVYGNTDPATILNCKFIVSLLILVSCITLSGFMNELFQKKKTRFYIIACAGVIILIIRYVDVSAFVVATAALTITVAIESFFIVVFSLFKKIRGTRIIGSGILLFAAFILFAFTTIFVKGGNMEINGDNLEGQVYIVFIILAILSIPVSMSVYLAWNFADINKNLSAQLVQVKMLSQKTLEQEQEKQRMLEGRKEELEKEVSERTAELREEKEKSDRLLRNILPEEIAGELKQNGKSDARGFDQVTVLFTDFKNFTLMSEQLSAQELVNEINYCYSAFDRIITQYGIEKIKTIGDAYMCAGGLPVPNKTNAVDAVRVALAIRDFMLTERKEREATGKTFFEIRIGLHTGPVIAGIVGIKKFAYDIWGDTVNIASRMESSGEAGKVNISGATHELVKEQFNCTFRGKVAAKNKGMVDMYFVEEHIDT